MWKQNREITRTGLRESEYQNISLLLKKHEMIWEAVGELITNDS
jgi:hypothetical protein